MTRSRQIQLVSLAVLLGAVIGLGSVRQPYGPVESYVPVYPPAPRSMAPIKSFRVATFNIHSGRGVDREKDLARTADALRAVDVAGLNEVRGPAILGGVDQAAGLGARLGAAAVFGPSERRWYAASFGNGLLSRFPILSWRSQPMRAGSRASYRAAISARVRIDGGTVGILVAHAERGGLRDAQLREIGDLFAALDPPAILLGDLNADLSHPELKRIGALPGVIHADAGPGKQIDHIFIKGLRARAAAAEPTQASDHPLVWADVELVAGPPADEPRVAPVGPGKPGS